MCSTSHTNTLQLQMLYTTNTKSLHNYATTKISRTDDTVIMNLINLQLGHTRERKMNKDTPSGKTDN